MLTATGIVNGRWQISTPTESTPLDRSPKKFGTGDYIGGLYGCVKFGKNSSMGASGQGVKYNDFLYLFYFMNSLQVRPVDRFSRLMAQTTRTRAHICLLGGFVDIAPHFGGEIPETPNFGGVNRRFQAKRAKILKVSDYRNYYIDFNQNLHNDRDHHVVVVDDPNSRPTNPRWRTAAI